jgi:serine/threonine-protein kinase
MAGITWLIYIALEPYVRRRWPETIISWSRMLSGSLSDPLVGRHVLIGVLAGIVFAIFDLPLRSLVRLWAGESPVTAGSMSALLGTRQLIASDLLAQFGVAIGVSLMLFFLIFLFRALTRRRWLAAVLFTVIFSAGSVLSSNEPVLGILLTILYNLLTAIILLRYGLLTMATIVLVNGLMTNIPVTTDLAAWYSGYTIATVVAVLALAGWAFHTSLGGEKLFSGNLLED